MHVSVVIPTFNRARLLRETLPGLTNQQVDPDLTYDILFVIDGSTDDTQAILEQAAASSSHPLRHI